MAGIGGYGKKSPTPPKKNTAAKVRDVLKDAAEAPVKDAEKLAHKIEGKDKAPAKEPPPTTPATK